MTTEVTDLEVMLEEEKARSKASKVRLNEIEDDLDQTEYLFKQSRSRKYRSAINKLRYALIVEQHSITHPKENF
jgi:hypothetical protein